MAGDRGAAPVLHVDVSDPALAPPGSAESKSAWRAAQAGSRLPKSTRPCSLGTPHNASSAPLVFDPVAPPLDTLGTLTAASDTNLTVSQDSIPLSDPLVARRASSGKATTTTRLPSITTARHNHTNAYNVYAPPPLTAHNHPAAPPPPPHRKRLSFGALASFFGGRPKENANAHGGGNARRRASAPASVRIPKEVDDWVNATYPIVAAPVDAPREPRPAPTLYALFGIASHGGALPEPSRCVLCTRAGALGAVGELHSSCIAHRDARFTDSAAAVAVGSEESDLACDGSHATLTRGRVRGRRAQRGEHA
jgi:hypothetical protein